MAAVMLSVMLLVSLMDKKSRFIFATSGEA